MTHLRNYRRLLTLGGLMAAASVFCMTAGTNAADRKVLAEDFNATWCGPCINVGLAISQLLDDYPDSYIAMQVHQSDSYTTTWGNQRANFYGVQGYPTVWTDGTILMYGSQGTVQANYNTLNNSRAQRMSTPTDVTISLGGAQVSGSTYAITAAVGLEETGEAKTVRLYIVQALDHYPSGGHYRNCQIQAAPYETLTLQPGDLQTVTHNFTFSGPSWQNQDDIRIIVWAQEPSSSAPADVYQAEMMSWPFPSLDCNGNGIPDPQDIADGTSLDCNLNGRPDECDMTEGADDCDENGVLDLCEVRSEVLDNTGDLGQIGGSEWAQYTIEDPIEQLESVLLTIRVNGDFSTSSEFIEVRLNDELLDVLFQTDGEDCIELEETIEIPRGQFNALTADQDAVFDFIPSTSVDPERCDGTSSIELELEYWVLGSEADQNANGIPDACEELPCPADLDGSGMVDVNDLLNLLGQWGESGVDADLDGSGTVDVGDLLIVLAAWGEC